MLGKISKLLMIGILLLPLGVAGDQPPAKAAPEKPITISGIIAKDTTHKVRIGEMG